MVTTSPHTRAQRSLILWALVTLFCLSAEIIALTLVSLSTPFPDNMALIEHRDALRQKMSSQEKNTMPTHDAETVSIAPVQKLQAYSLKTLLEILTDALDQNTRIIECIITQNGATVRLEARTSESLDATITALLATPNLLSIALTERTHGDTGYCATLTSESWEL